MADSSEDGLPQRVRDTDGHWSASSSLQLMTIRSDGSYSAQQLDSNSASGTAMTINGTSGFFGMGRAISDGQGGALFTLSSPPSLYHVSSGGSSKIGLPITPDAPPGDDLFLADSMLLAADGTAYITGSSTLEAPVDTIVAVDSSSGNVKWAASPGLHPKLSTVTSDGSLAFQYALADFSVHSALADSTGNVSPLFTNPDSSDAGPVLTESFGFHLPSYWTLGTWHAYQPDLTLAAITGKAIATALLYSESQGSAKKGHAPQKPDVAHFIPVDQTSLGISSQAALTQIEQLLPQPVADHLPFLGSAATAPKFLNIVARPIRAIGFIGHSVDPPDPSPLDGNFYSVGLRFFGGQALVLPPTDVPPFPVPTYVNSITTTRINTQARVVFIGSCFNGPSFMSLWNIHDQTITEQATKGQAMIVLANPNSAVILGHAVVEWARILDDMILQHMSVDAAVAEANQYLLNQGRDVQGNPITEQWKVVGDGNVKIN